MDIAERITIISIIVTTSVGLVEFTAGAVFGSIAVVAAGMDAIADTFTSVGVITGLRVSRRPPDANHLYGHRQAETLASAFLSIALIFAGIRIAYSAVDGLYHGTALAASIQLFMVALMAVVVSAVLARYKIAIGKKTGNLSVVADGYHTLTDAISAAAVLIGLGFVKIGYSAADPIVALAISALVIRWGVGIGWNAINILMGVSPGPRVMADIKKVALSVQGVSDCHRCRARKVGSRIFADLHLLVDSKTHVDEAHAIASKVEHRIKDKIPNMSSVIVHVEPIRRKTRGKVSSRSQS